MKGASEIRISSRSLVQLMGGFLTESQLMELHGFAVTGDNSRITTFFRNQVLRGRTISEVHVEKVANEDDDWIVFRFDDPDPAIAPFRVPDSPPSR